uniref:Cytochrome b6-f complex subunit 6 n=1 Tax=Equisetum arvense TaxID=3258 RepID=E3T2S8_EQUAR|nr:cytochrome b6/f complex subunit VI [Equisetum arvense]ADA63566.1 cytochrome b6/f complex subunit VI [Equisetum arvense]AEV58357.1 cytochrome b6/f complex subunit VI [Equisetum arvense]
MITLISYFVLLLAALTLTTFLFISLNKIQLI